MSQTQAHSKSARDAHDPAFVFVQELAAELNRGKVELPSIPDILVRVRKVLADEFVSIGQVVRVINSEPALAAQLLRISNSRSMNPSGTANTDLRTAVTRVGFNLVRSAAISFAIQQLKKIEGLKGMEKPLDELWRRSAEVAAMSYVVARRHSTVNPDAALLAGMLHRIGRLYILTRSAQHPALFADNTALAEIVRNWSAPIAKALLENWQMPGEIVTAVSEYEDSEREHAGPADLTDVLTVSSWLVIFKDSPESMELNLQDVRACKRLKMDLPSYQKLLEESRTEVEALRQALGM
jgi:HD-like signal output (HDOD) protein